MFGGGASKHEFSMTQNPVPYARSEARNVFAFNDYGCIVNQISVTNHLVLDSTFVFLVSWNTSFLLEGG